MGASMSYQGHTDWGYWNVSLWLLNDEGLYRLACESMSRAGFRPRLAAQWLRARLPARTPDGARYTVQRLTAALRAFDRLD